MNVVLWILQAALVFLLLGGGVTKAFKLDSVGSMPAMQALPPAAWKLLGLFELACAILMIVPLALSWMPELTTYAAAAVAVECLLVSAVYARGSRQLAASNPLVWSLAMAALGAAIAYGRYALV
jgi:hypothetical protein